MAKTEDELLFRSHSFQNKTVYMGRKSRGVYDLDTIPDTDFDQQNNFNRLHNLSLLKPETDDEEYRTPTSEYEERPVTPINEGIRAPPRSYASLCRHIRRRINPRPHWSHISIEDQQSLAAVLLGEVNAIWSVFRKQVDDPFLTLRQNKELQRRITVHIVTVCEQLFLYFCNQVKILNSRGVFSPAANMSRIRGQIALSADKYLNLLAVRRHIISDLRNNSEIASIMTVKKKDPITPVTPKVPKHLSFQSLIQTSSPQQQTSHFSITEEIKDMKRKMPSLDLSKVQLVLRRMTTDQEDDEDDIEDEEESVKSLSDHPPEEIPKKIRKWLSEPLLNTGSLSGLIEEQEDIDAASRFSKDLSALKLFESTKRLITSARAAVSVPEFAITGITHQKILDPQQDLKHLMAKQKGFDVEFSYSLDDKDIPPLVKAITRRQIQDERVKKMKQEERELDARKIQHEQEERQPLALPKYPQPPVVQMKIPGYANPVDKSEVTIRSSDIHIPDKVDLPLASIEMRGPLFNDLTGEISPATVKELDANLFQGEELAEVYSEIMKSVTNDHHKFDNDPLIVHPASSVNINKVLASCTLSRPKSQQVINPALKRPGILPPWAGEPSPTAWNQKNVPPKSSNTSGTDSNLQDSPSQLNLAQKKRSSRSYASWLAWWKATINTDDYFKYLSTKETDFLGVIYHFYDSEHDESEAEVSSRSSELEEEKKRGQLLNEIKARKEHYVPGVWNVNSVLLGGLGKYPDLTEYESDQKTVGIVVNQEDQAALDDSSVSPNPVQRVTSDESADSESSVQIHPSPRRKSTTPRRRARVNVPPVLSTTSDEKSIVASRTNSSETTKRDIALKRMPTKVHEVLTDSSESSDLVKGKPESTAKTPSMGRISDSSEIPLEFSVDSVGLLPLGGSWLRVNNSQSVQRQAKENKPLSTDSDYEEPESNRKNKLAPAAENNREEVYIEDTTSGYMSLESTSDQKTKVQCKRKLSSRQRSSRSYFKQVEEEPSNYHDKEWRPRDAIVRTPTARLLQGYFRSAKSIRPLSSDQSSDDVYGSLFSHPASSSQRSPDEKSLSTVSHKQAAPVSLQSRLESVWKKLKMTTSQKLNAALKYSTDEYLPLLDQIVVAWEKVAESIQKREKVLHDLELFERDASDPHRFFFKGAKGSSIARLQEAKIRAVLYQKLANLEKGISPMLDSMRASYKEIVTFEGRPYHEKMAMDKTEMLYWLQQERRCMRLDQQGHPEQLKQFMRDNRVDLTKTTSVTKPLTAPLSVSIVRIEQNN